MGPLKAASLALLGLYGCAEAPPAPAPTVVSGPIVPDFSRPAHPVVRHAEPATAQDHLDNIDAALKRANETLDAHDKR